MHLYAATTIQPSRPSMHLRAGLFLLVAACCVLTQYQAEAQSARAAATIRGNVVATTHESPEDAVRRFALLNKYAIAKALAAASDSATEGRPTLAEKVVVYLESPVFKGMKFPASAKRPVLDQRGMQFRPQVLAILAGTTVEFPNQDNVFHNVFSYSEPGDFDLGRYPKGDSRSVRFDTPGIVRVYCDIHASMNAIILVLDNPFFSAPDERGMYEISDIPPGEYVVHCWYGRAHVSQRTVTLRPGDNLTIDFVL
ncbi:MAG: hypothetical protein HY962_10840 [Ignavibacteriae bacterium]|nr:hypothetical protein [Ignavibacteriota bacterium]